MAQRWKKGEADPQARRSVLVTVPLAESIDVSGVSRVKLDIICPDIGSKVTVNLKSLDNAIGDEWQAETVLDWKHVQVALRHDLILVLRNSFGEARFSVERANDNDLPRPDYDSRGN